MNIDGGVSNDTTSDEQETAQHVCVLSLCVVFYVTIKVSKTSDLLHVIKSQSSLD